MAMEGYMSAMDARLSDIERCLLMIQRHFGIDEGDTPGISTLATDSDFDIFRKNLNDNIYRNHVVSYIRCLVLLLMFHEKRLFIMFVSIN
jgi:hypothetical protein